MMRLRVTVLLSVALALAGCATKRELIDAVHAVNDVFQADTEALLREQGTRTYPVPKARAFAAMQRALVEFGMSITAQDSELGYLRAAAPAPRPLTDAEWAETVEVELPRMRKIIREHAGLIGWFVPFEPEGLDIVLNVSVRALDAATTEVGMTMRLHETKPPRTGFPRREYPPPHGLRLGLPRFWATYEHALENTPPTQ